MDDAVGNVELAGVIFVGGVVDAAADAVHTELDFGGWATGNGHGLNAAIGVKTGRELTFAFEHSGRPSAHTDQR